MKAWELGLLGAMFGAIVWGVIFYFRRPNRREWRSNVLSVLALGGVANQVMQTIQVTNAPVRSALAALMYVASLSLFVAAVRACGAARPTAIFERDVPSWLVCRGPYRVVRHPFYASYAIFWIAGWVGTGVFSTALVAMTMVAIYVAAARREEAKFAASPFAADYQAYRRRAGLFWPRVSLPVR
jgi:protein-S-isoprenylcysteine O-methyltransferase Ste14